MKRKLFFLSSVVALLLLLSDICASDRIFDGSVSDIPDAASGVVDFYYEADTGGVTLSVGEDVLILGVEGTNNSVFDFSRFNSNTALGQPSQVDSGGLGFLSFSGLPTGVHHLGPILPADISIIDGDQFDTRFSGLIGRWVLAGQPERNTQFNILPPEFPSDPPDPPVYMPVEPPVIPPTNPPPVTPPNPLVDPPPPVEPPFEPPVGTPVVPTTPSDIELADPGTFGLYYDPFTGNIHASVGEDVLIISVEGGDYNLQNINRDTPLGLPAQADRSGIGWLNFKGLNAGIHDLGMLLEPAPEVYDGSVSLQDRFGILFGRSGAVGTPSRFTSVQVLSPNTSYINPPVDPPVSPPVNPPTDPPVNPPGPPVGPPVDPPVIDPELPIPPPISEPGEIEVPRDGSVSAYYDVATGEVFLAVGSDVTIVGLEGANFVSSNLNDKTRLGSPSQNDADGIGFLNFAGLPTGIFNLGQILEGDDIARLDSLVIRSSGAGLSETRGGLRIIRGLPPAIPEPSSFALLSLTATSFIARRRRK